MEQYRVVLIHDWKLYISWSGEIYTGDILEKLLELIILEEPFYIAGVNLYTYLSELNNSLQNVIRGWNLRFTNRRRQIPYRKQDGTLLVGGQFFTDFISIHKRRRTNRTRFNGERRRSTKKFMIMNLETFKTPVPDDPIDQVDMASAILDMCDQRGVKFRSTRGTLGAALLKASPKWEPGRRSAFPFINQEARKHMVGNHYSRSNRMKRDYIKGEDHRLNATLEHAYLIDQNSAHHNIASQIKLPHPEDIRARGFWKQAIEGKPRDWCHPYSAIGQKIMKGELIGLHLVRVRVVHMGPTVKHFQLPFALKSGGSMQWVWTPDLRIIEQTPQIVLESICCSYSGVKQDEALKEYADWALSEIARDVPNATYKKSILLSAYGMLAFNLVDKAMYRYYGGPRNRPGHEIEIPRAGLVTERKIQLPIGMEPSIVNVINRGLIESETRARSLEYARELHMLGYHVAQVYADALIVETDNMPFPKEGWRVSHSLSNVWMPRDNAFMSDSICKLPGFARGNVEDQIWRENYEKAKIPFGT